MLIKSCKISKLVMYLNSCSMDFGHDMNWLIRKIDFGSRDLKSCGQNLEIETQNSFTSMLHKERGKI